MGTSPRDHQKLKNAGFTPENDNVLIGGLIAVWMNEQSRFDRGSSLLDG